jgi:hypothetical protein
VINMERWRLIVLCWGSSSVAVFVCFLAIAETMNRVVLVVGRGGTEVVVGRRWPVAGG